MDLLIPNSWLKKFLDTKAKPTEIAKYLSLCGPSVERIKTTTDGDSVYSIEITTNRVDCAGVVGIAREAASILPRFGITTKLKSHDLEESSKYKFTKKVKYLDVKVDPKLCPRFTAVLIKDVTIKESTKEIKDLLEKVGVRSINNIVDVSNYIMHELGQPVHTFDYDKLSLAGKAGKIVGHKMILRESKKGERITTLDGKDFKLPGGDIVIEDGSKRLIDLCGIMGGENSAIDDNTKNVLLFVQTYNQHKIRKTSMTLAQRSEAAVLFEKGLDPEMVKPAMINSIKLIEKLSGGKAEVEVLDIYPKPYVKKFVNTTLTEQEKIIGVKLNTKDVTNYLVNLGFSVLWKGESLKVGVPSFRSQDINIPEDIAEEIARIYGYHNLPNILMTGELPKQRQDDALKFEGEVKTILKSFGATEVLNLSLTDKENAGDNAIRLKNALGSDTEYLRTSLRPGLIENTKSNSRDERLHLFELSNVYLSKKNDLPEERLMLAGIIKGVEYRKSKGIVEILLEELKIEYVTKVADANEYLPNQRIEIYSGKNKIGEYGNLKDVFYYEFEIEKLITAKRVNIKFKEISKFPPQIEDITIELPEKTYIGDLITEIRDLQNTIYKVQLKDIFKNNYTLNIQYQDSRKTLTDKEVEVIRNKIIKLVKDKFGGIVKN